MRKGGQGAEFTTGRRVTSASAYQQLALFSHKGDGARK